MRGEREEAHSFTSSSLLHTRPWAKGLTTHYFVIYPQQDHEAGRIPILKMSKLRLKEVWHGARSHTACKSQSQDLIPGLPNLQSRAVSGRNPILKVQSVRLPNKKNSKNSMRKGPTSQKKSRQNINKWVTRKYKWPHPHDKTMDTY